jgi:hypothetical protein
LDAGDDETVGTLNWPASSPQRDFLLWRLSDAGRRIRGAKPCKRPFGSGAPMTLITPGQRLGS